MTLGHQTKGLPTCPQACTGRGTSSLKYRNGSPRDTTKPSEVCHRCSNYNSLFSYRWVFLQIVCNQSCSRWRRGFRIWRCIDVLPRKHCRWSGPRCSLCQQLYVCLSVTSRTAFATVQGVWKKIWPSMRQQLKGQDDVWEYKMMFIETWIKRMKFGKYV